MEIKVWYFKNFGNKLREGKKNYVKYIIWFINIIEKLDIDFYLNIVI